MAQNTVQPSPFPRYLPHLTWQDCFSYGRQDILTLFVTPLCNAGSNGPPVRKLAYLLAKMMRQAPDQPASTAIVMGLASQTSQNTPTIRTVVNGSSLGVVHWQPSGKARGLHLYCHAIYDLLAACMSEAAHIHYEDPIRRTRTKRNFFSLLASLFSHWCANLIAVAEPRRRPRMTSLVKMDEMVILGCTIPSIPGVTNGKEMIQQARLRDLLRRGRIDANGERIDPTRVDFMDQDYGHCAETWSFALLCKLTDDELKRASGIAIRTPNPGIRGYSRDAESNRYAPLCVNCERMYKQIIRWGRPTDVVVQRFSVSAWVSPYLDR